MTYTLSATEAARIVALLIEARRILSGLSSTAGDRPERYRDVRDTIHQAVDLLVRAAEILEIHDRGLLPCPHCYRPGPFCVCL